MNKSIKKRAKSMLPEIKELITFRALNEKQNRNRLADELIEEIRERFPEETTPQFETIIKLISAARNHEQLPIDQQWTPLKLNEYELVPEAIAKIFELRAKGLEFLSIRQAAWISRLSKMPLSVDVIYSIAYLYSEIEKMGEIAKITPDSSDIDNYLIKCIKNPSIGMRDYGRWNDTITKCIKQEFFSEVFKGMGNNMPNEEKNRLKSLLERGKSLGVIKDGEM